MRAKLAVVIAGIGMLLGGAVAPISAHHDVMAAFAANQPLQLKGTITKMEWTNPHTRLFVDVKNQGGVVENWVVEAGSPYVLARRGITKESMRPGTRVAIAGYRAKDGSRRITVNHPQAGIFHEAIVRAD